MRFLPKPKNVWVSKLGFWSYLGWISVECEVAASSVPLIVANADMFLILLSASEWRSFGFKAIICQNSGFACMSYATCKTEAYITLVDQTMFDLAYETHIYKLEFEWL